MSFAITTEQIKARTKDVTRRLGWTFLKPGDVLNAVNKSMGLKKGEKPEVYCQIRAVSVHQEPLCWITEEEVAREGYPGQTPEFFIDKFCKAMKCPPEQTVTRIEFAYSEDGQKS
jgi:hypothetical protein